MLILVISDFWNNIVDMIQQVGIDINSWDWVAISTQVKNWLLSGTGIAIVGLFIKFVLPYMKDKKMLTLFGKLFLRIQSLESENQTVGNILTEYISLQSETNVMSKTLSKEQKNKFTLLAEKLKKMQNERLQTIGQDIENMVDDNIITADEAIELSKDIPIVKETLGININDIGKR